MIPRPAFYGAVLFKRLMGRRVLSTNFARPQQPDLRVWAHCTATAQHDGSPLSPYSHQPGSVTVLVINISRFHANTAIISTISNTAHIYMLTSGGAPSDLASTSVRLNGEILHPVNPVTGELPPLSPTSMTRRDDGTVHINLQPASAAFVVLQGEQALACM